MKSILKYFISLVLLMIATVHGHGQVGRYIPSALRLGADPGTLGYMLLSGKRNFFEAEADMDIDRFFVVADYGISGYKLNEASYSYDNNGSYLRLGADINLMHENKHHNVAFLGLRYASSSFSDQLDFDTRAVLQTNTGWPSTLETVKNDHAKAHWAEMVVGMRIRIVKQLFMGFTGRYQFAMHISQAQNFKPYYVPGFGKSINKSSFGFNYYISYRLPFRKKIVYTDQNNKVIEDKKE